MSLLSAALEHTAESSPFTTLETFRKHLDPAWVEEALAATGTASLRKRRLPAEQVIWLVIGMALMRDRPMPEVIAKLELVLPGAKGEDVAASAISKARQRVGEEPLAWLFERCAQHWAHTSARTDAWRGLGLYAVDGTTLRVPDSMENRAYFGLADGGHRGPSGYPLVRLVTLLAVRSHLMRAG
jgi:Insertion element 4 transposase N-terminal